MIPKECDVIIVGGGPAGSTAPTLLSQKGYQAVLLEKEKHPRYPVGESIIPDFWRYTDQIGATEKVMAEGFMQKMGGTVNWHGEIRPHTFRDFGYTRPALPVERDRLDYILLQHARSQGVQVFEETAAITFHYDTKQQLATLTHRHTQGQITGRFVIDGSGQNAFIGKQLGLRVTDDQFRFMSISGYFNDGKYVAADATVQPFANRQTIKPTTFISSLDGLGNWGWLWHITLRDNISVGLVEVMQQIKSQYRPHWDNYFLHVCHQHNYLSQMLNEAHFCPGSLRLIRNYSYQPKEIAGPGFFLIGDAAGFVDPVFSLTVVIAMYSGSIAAWAVERCLQTPQTTALTQSLFARQLMGRLSVARPLALPGYGKAKAISTLARESVKLESGSSRELMHAASTLTTRSGNYLALVGEQAPANHHHHLVKTLSSLIFVEEKVALE